MISSLLYDSSKDELFLMAKGLIATRSKFQPYSPTEDIYRLRETIINYTCHAALCAELFSCLSAIASSTEVVGAKYIVRILVKYPITFKLIMSMLKDIDDIVLGTNNNYSCNLSKNTIIEILGLIADNYMDKFEDYVDNYSKRIGTFFDNFINGGKISLSGKKYGISKTMFCMMGLSLASNTMVLGWMYMHFLNGKINNHRGVCFDLNDDISKLFISEFKTYKDDVKRVNNYACETVRIPDTTNRYFDGNEFDGEKYIQDIVASIYEDEKLRFNLEKDEHKKIADNTIILQSFGTTLITDDIANFTTYFLFRNHSLSESFLSFFCDKNQCNAFKNSWDIMIRKYVKQSSGNTMESLGNIKSRYINYICGGIDPPQIIFIDYSDPDNINHLLYPNVQGCNAIINTLLTIFDVEQRQPQKLEPSIIFLYWSYMFADIYLSRSNEWESDSYSALSYILYANIRLFAPINRHTTDCFFNTINISTIHMECKKAMPKMDDIIDYLPEHFEVLRYNKQDGELWTKCVNDVMTRYLAENLWEILSGNVTAEDAIRSLDTVSISKLFINYIMSLYSRFV